MPGIRFGGLSILISGTSLYGVERPELREDEFEFAPVGRDMVVADAARLTQAIANDGEGDKDGLLRMRLLHSLVAQEIEFVGTSGDAIPEWLLRALDDTEWAVQETGTAAKAA